MRAAATTVVGLTALVLGALIGSAALFAAGTALSLVVIYAGVVVLAASRRVRLDRRVGAPEVVEGEPLEVEIPLGLRRGLGIVCELVSPGAPALPLHPGTNRATLVFARRGSYMLAPSTIRVRDPLGLFAAERPAGPPVPLLVLPRGLAGPRATSLRALPRDGEPVEPDGLGEYRPGTPASRLHWASLARGAGLLERRLGEERVDAPLYVVDTSGAEDPEHADRIVRTAVAHILQRARAGGCAVLLPGDDTPVEIGPDLRAWPDVHRRLALLGHAA